MKFLRIFNNFIEIAKSAIGNVANGYNKGGKNFYLNYSAYDALNIVGDAIDKIDDKLVELYATRMEISKKIEIKPNQTITLDL